MGNEQVSGPVFEFREQNNISREKLGLLIGASWSTIKITENLGAGFRSKRLQREFAILVKRYEAFRRNGIAFGKAFAQCRQENKILIVRGPHISGKTFLSRGCGKQVWFISGPDVITVPYAIERGYDVIMFDNLASITRALSDDMCNMLHVGSARNTQIILNGVNIKPAADLADRSIVVDLEATLE